MANNLLFSYKLLNNDAAKTANTDGLFVSSWGSATEQGRKYWLEISAQAQSWAVDSSLVMQSIDLTVNFDNKLFSPVVAGDLLISSALPLLRSATLTDVGENGALQSSINFSAGGAENIQTGTGITLSTSAFTTIARLLVNVNDAYFRTHTLTGADDTLDGEGDITLRDEAAASPVNLNLSQLLSFQVNGGNTVFGDLETLAVKGGTAQELENTSVNVLRATQLVDIRGATFDTYEPLGTKLNFGAADGNKTNLIRAGSSLTRTFDIANVGSSSLQDLKLTNLGSVSPDTATATLKASRRARNSDGSLSAAGNAVEVEASATKLSTTSLAENSLGLVREDSGAVKSLNIGGKNSSGDVLSLELSVEASGAAGSVLELTNAGGFKLEADGFTKEFAGLSTKNLITYQGDLNYDGKVSFMDLAYLNAGAAEYKKAPNDSTRKSFADVDANFDGAINIADLTILEADWGKSLHTAVGAFTGSTGFDDGNSATTDDWKIGMTQFGVDDSAWVNTAFDAENAIGPVSATFAITTIADIS